MLMTLKLENRLQAMCLCQLEGRCVEYVGIYEGGKQAKWMTSWYFELDQFFDLPVTLYCDNNAALSLSKNSSGHSKVKHVEMRTHWIREVVERGEVVIEPVSSEDNVADLFTKALPRPKLERFIKMLGMEYLDIYSRLHNSVKTKIFKNDHV